MAGVHVRGVEKVSLRMRLIGSLAVVGAGIAMRRCLERVVRQERVLLSLGWHPEGTKTGSLPGQPPWRVSGHLSRSAEVIGPRLIGTWSLKWVGKAGNSAVYARIHELGGVTGAGYRTHLPPRPYLRPAWRIVKPTFKATFDHELRRVLKL